MYVFNQAVPGRPLQSCPAWSNLSSQLVGPRCRCEIKLSSNSEPQTHTLPTPIPPSPSWLLTLMWAFWLNTHVYMYFSQPSPKWTAGLWNNISTPWREPREWIVWMRGGGMFKRWHILRIAIHGFVPSITFQSTYAVKSSSSMFEKKKGNESLLG